MINFRIGTILVELTVADYIIVTNFWVNLIFESALKRAPHTQLLFALDSDKVSGSRGTIVSSYNNDRIIVRFWWWGGQIEE